MGLEVVLESLPGIRNIIFYQNLDVESGQQLLRFQCEVDQGAAFIIQASETFQDGSAIQIQKKPSFSKNVISTSRHKLQQHILTTPHHHSPIPIFKKNFFPPYYARVSQIYCDNQSKARLILLMSEQVDGHLQLPSSYNFHRQTTQQPRANSIDAQKFHQWTRNDMYRSSYAHYHSPESSSPRSGHLPGYGGFIPTNRAESLHAATYTNMAKSALNSPGLNLNPGQLSSTGRNLNPQALIDNSKNASSHKYGKTEIQTPHPAWVPQQWSSTTKATYISPDQYSVPTHRDTDKHLQTTKMKTKQSGFQRDRAYWDGNGWKPNPILNPACLTSEYRERFNPEMDYHRKVEKDSLPQLKRPEYKYKFNK